MAEEILARHILAADNHNYGNIGTSWLDPGTWAQKVGDGGSLIATSILSGANSFYNTAIHVANWFGADVSENNTQNWISSIDSDFGAYYRQNTDAADFGGFVLGSLIPGLGGVKLFNAGQTALRTASQTGFLGKNLSLGTGLLLPKTEQYVAGAVDAINQSISAHKLLNAQTAKALGAGLWQNILEAAAFETAVQATMFKSPILESQDGFDIVKNIAVGGVIGGAIGGAFGAAKIFGTLKKEMKLEDVNRLPFTSRPKFADITDPVEKIIILAEDTDLAAVPVILKKADGSIINNKYSVDKPLYDQKVQRNNNEIRTNIHAITPDDKELGNVIANTSQGLSHTQMFANFAGADEITRINKLSKGDKAVSKAVIAEEPNPGFSNRYVKLIGEDAGNTLANAPMIRSLGDIFESKDQILAAIRKADFSIQESWNPLLKIPSGEPLYLIAEKRHIWAQDVLKEIKPGTLIGEFDIPILERALKDNIWDQVKVSTASGNQGFTSKAELAAYVKDTKQYVAGKLMAEQNTEAISVITNVKRSYFEGTRTNDVDDLFAMQSSNRAYLTTLESKGLSKNLDEAIDPKYLPKWAKVTYRTDQLQPDGGVTDALVFYKQKQKVYEEAARRIGARIFGNDITSSLPPISDTTLYTASRTGSGPGLVSAENSNYGSLSSMMAWLGGKTKQGKELLRKDTQDILEGSLMRMGNKPEAALEFEAANQKVLRSNKNWMYYDDGTQSGLITKDAYKKFGSPDTGLNEAGEEVLLSNRTLVNLKDLSGDELIYIKNAETRQVIKDHVTREGQRRGYTSEIRAAQGHSDVKDPTVFVPIRANISDYPHYAFVTDPKVSGSGHVSMLHAATEKDLAALIDRVPTNYKVITKKESEALSAARGEYEFSRGLHENYIAADMNSKGIYSNFFAKTNPQKIIDDILQQHLRSDDTLAYETMRLMYEPQFNWLEDLGTAYSQVATSKFGSFTKALEKTQDNPYFNYIKTALDISKINEHPLLYSANKLLDTAVSRATAAVRNVWNGVKTPAELDRVNAAMDEFGMKPAFLPAYDAGMYELVNHAAPRGDLTKFVRGANAILGRFTLGLDPLNALNNAVGANILRGTELKHITDAIRTGNREIAGELGGLAKVIVPGTDDGILSPTKLVTNAIRNFWTDTDNALLNQYKASGYIKDRLEQFKLIVDDFSLKGTETVADLNKRMSGAFERAKKLADQGEALTGNKFAEEFNRFISANIMDQITQVGIKHNLLSRAEAATYINTFVNRVEGNIIASQRPLIFQGPIGQAIGLFQSYQFNLIQQLFRYVAEGSGKDMAMLVGLQSTLYGVQSLPAFQYINTHIVGQLSGNKDHTDLYDKTYGALGRVGGDFLLYGLPSNVLQANIYSRGDINPRQITVIPTNLQEVPIVAGWGKFFGSIKETVSNIGLGGSVWESMLRGLEHNGISRPLAGLAQVLQTTSTGQVVSTSNKGSILSSHDLFEWASLTRLAGGRPLDEAVVNDALFRVNYYESSRRQQLQQLSEAVKSTMLAGTSPTDAQVNTFSEKYVYLGGKQANFNKWMMDMYKGANVPQSRQLESSLRNPYAYKMQLLMGGDTE